MTEPDGEFWDFHSDERHIIDQLRLIPKRLKDIFRECGFKALIPRFRQTEIARGVLS